MNNEQRYFDALKRITVYHSVEQLRRKSEKDYGLNWTEALEYAYQNVIDEARQAVRGRRRPKEGDQMKTILFVLFTMAVAASAAVIPCGGVSDVTISLNAGSGNACQVNNSPLLFSNFAVNASAGFTGSAIGISPLSAVIGAEVDLLFQIVNVPATAMMGDVILTYRVNGPINGVDLLFQGTPLDAGGGVTITEQVCDVAFVLGVCQGRTLANYAVSSFGNTVSDGRTFPLQAVVWIQKDVSYRDGAMSQFANSQRMGSVPEPVTLSMVGIGLLGLGVLRRRRARRGRRRDPK